MPQMAPMNWLFLFFMFFAIFLISFFKIFFLFSSSADNLIPPSLNSFNTNNLWKW